jgi:DNA sulfur modification protein DndC
MRVQPSLFEGVRMSLDDSIGMSLASLYQYGRKYHHWAIAYSGGKDSTATVSFVAWAIKSGEVPMPESLAILYADTRMELPPLQQGAIKLLSQMAERGFQTRIVLPPIDERFYVYMLGRGVPPPKNRFRWCTSQIKVEPMLAALRSVREKAGEKILMLTGVRLGESAARDARIALSCSKDSGECGQGWFQRSNSDAVSDTLAPLIHWRLCHVYDWLYFDQRHGYDVAGIATVYGEDDVRTGCVGCNLTEKDTALRRVLRSPQWAHLAPLLELKPLYRELTLAKWRKRKAAPEVLKDGSYSKNGQRMGPLTMDGRAMGLARILDIQDRARVDLINSEEEARIRDLWVMNTWPQKWSEQDIDAAAPINFISSVGNTLVTQSLLVR